MKRRRVWRRYLPYRISLPSLHTCPGYLSYRRAEASVTGSAAQAGLRRLMNIAGGDEGAAGQKSAEMLTHAIACARAIPFFDFFRVCLPEKQNREEYHGHDDATRPLFVPAAFCLSLPLRIAGTPYPARRDTTYCLYCRERRAGARRHDQKGAPGRSDGRLSHTDTCRSAAMVGFFLNMGERGRLEILCRYYFPSRLDARCLEMIGHIYMLHISAASLSRHSACREITHFSARHAVDFANAADFVIPIFLLLMPYT